MGELQAQTGYARGTVLLGRECFALEHQVDAGQQPPHSDGRPIRYDEDGRWICPHYRATDPPPPLAYPDSGDGPECRWRSAAMMPRWAVRIRLPVTRCEAVRVREMTFQQCLALDIIFSPYWEGVTVDDLQAAPQRDFKKDYPDYPTDAQVDGIDKGWNAYVHLATQHYWAARHGQRYLWDTAWAWYLEV